jgi:hypothetical protein
MKITICYFESLGGQVFKNNLGGIIPSDKCFKIFKEKIVKSNPDCKFNFFIHSWSTTHEKEILNTIKPVNFIMEP